MKHTYLTFVALGLALAASTQAGTFIPAENESYDTETLRKITFDGDVVVAEWADTGTNRYEFSNLQRILFSEGKGDATGSESPGALQLFLYPNPVTETLCLDGVPEGAEVLMFGSDGTCMGSFLANGTQLKANVSGIKNGVYFLKIGDKAVKFIKK